MQEGDVQLSIIKVIFVPPTAFPTPLLKWSDTSLTKVVGFTRRSVPETYVAEIPLPLLKICKI